MPGPPDRVPGKPPSILLLVFCAFALSVIAARSSADQAAPGATLDEVGAGDSIAGMTLGDCVTELASDVRPRRLRAIRTLGMFGESAGEPLVAALEHEDPAVRFLAATALGRIGGSSLTDALSKLQQMAGDPSSDAEGDRSPSVRVAAAYALCEAGKADSYLGVLIAALEDPDRGMACYSADLMGRLGSDASAALPALEKMHAANKPGVSGGDYHRGGAAMNAIREIRS